MKSIVLLIIVTIIPCLINAQSNLQFSNVAYFTLSCSSASPSCLKDTSITIPQNKVWKIESAGISSGTNSEFLIFLNDVEIKCGTTNGCGQNNYIFPIWLASGTHKFSIYTGSINVRGYISAIEFIISP